MSKMSDMSMTIEELRSATAAINEAANWLAEQFSGTADSSPADKICALYNDSVLTLDAYLSILYSRL